LEEHKLEVSEKMALKRIFGQKRNEMAGGWRKLHNEKIYKVYSSPNIKVEVKWDEMGRACSSYGENRNTYRLFFVGEPEGKRPL
jgi:hypothetical protein